VTNQLIATSLHLIYFTYLQMTIHSFVMHFLPFSSLLADRTARTASLGSIMSSVSQTLSQSVSRSTGSVIDP